VDVPFLPLTTLCTKRTSPLFISQTRQNCIYQNLRRIFYLFLDFGGFSTTPPTHCPFCRFRHCRLPSDLAAGFQQNLILVGTYLHASQ